MSQQCTIDYKIKDASKYQTVRKQIMDSKQLTHINQKSKNFTFISEQNRFEIELQFKVPAIITTILYSVKNTNQICFQFYNEDNKILTKEESKKTDEVRVLGNKMVKLGDESGRFDRVVVKFLNFPDPKQTCINHIIFKGFKQGSDKKPAPKIKNLSQNDTFQPASKKKIGQQQKKVFNTRNKQRKVTTPQDLVQQVQYGYSKSSKKVSKQDQQLQKALELSKKQYNRSIKKQKIEQQNPPQVQIREQPSYQSFPPQYQTIQFQKIKKTFQHVTQQWIQAQRQAQTRKDIRKVHSLADRIKVKVFREQKFCINNILGSERTRISGIIGELGGRVVEEPTDGVILVTNRMEGGKVNMAKGCKGVWFVKPEYLFDCDKMKYKLDMKDYLP